MFRLFILGLFCLFLPSQALSGGGNWEPFGGYPVYIDPDGDFDSVEEKMNLFLKYAFPSLFEGCQTPKDNPSISFDAYRDALNALETSKNLTPSVIPHLQKPDPRDWFPSSQSNTYDTALLFLRAAFMDPAVTGQHQELIRLRHALLSHCGGQEEDTDLLKQIHNLDPKVVSFYGRYLEGTYSFYQQDYEKAFKIFQMIARETHPLSQRWLHETAIYMQARTLLILAQKNWDGYETNSPALDRTRLAHSLNIFQHYLKVFPQGLYADSATHIQRRLFYLLGDQQKLNTPLKALFNQAASEMERNPDAERCANLRLIANEFRVYFKGPLDYSKDSPLLIAWDISSSPTSEKLAALEANAKRFAPYPEALFLFLQSRTLYKLERYEELLLKIPTITLSNPEDRILISIVMLQIRSLRVLKKYDQALALLEELLAALPIENTPHVHLERICLYFEQGHKEKLLQQSITPPPLDLRRSVIRYGFSDTEIRSLLDSSEINPENRDALLQELMYRFLKRGSFQEATALYKKARPEELRPFRTLEPAVARLAVAPRDPQVLLTLGKFLYAAREDDVSDELTRRCSRCEASQFTQQKLAFASRIDLQETVPPLIYFRRIVEESKKSHRKSLIEAEALHYLVAHCFRGSSPAYYCQRGHSFENQSRAWFQYLHKKYKETEWAKKTPCWYE